MTTYCSAQYIDSKIKFYLGISQGGFMGADKITDGNFSAPSLFASHKGFSGQSFKALAKINALINFGIGVDIIKASNWENYNSTNYNKSEIKQYSLSPIIQFHTFFNKFNTYNGINLILEITPTFGQSEIILKNSIWDIQSNTGPVTPPFKSKDYFYGVKAGAGLEWSINQYIGVFLNYSFQQNWISSDLYPDRHFLRKQLDFGLFLKIIKDKRYYR